MSRPPTTAVASRDAVADVQTRGLLLAEDVHKRYGGVHALRGARLDVRAGEVHGLIGENGSGKSTLIKVLSGQVAPDRGRLEMDGEPLRVDSPAHALACGIATVSQETTLVPELTVAENIMLGRGMERRWYGIDWRGTRRRAEWALDRLGLAIDLDETVRRLRPDEQQLVEIARALSVDARVLILDEPTSSLTDDEVAALFEVVRGLRAEGVATIFVSHRLSEVMEITDRVTVLRDGVTAGGDVTGELDRDRMVELMVGRALQSRQRAEAAGEHPESMLRVRDLAASGGVRDISFDVGHGEIVGLAGLVGAGRSELLAALFGLDPHAAGTIEIDGEPIACRGPRDAIALGIAYVPADRQHQGLILGMSVAENLLGPCTARRNRLGHPPRTREWQIVEDAIARFRIATDRPDAPVAHLSGGNQQKVVLAKWLATSPRVLLLDEPTRGVDVGAKSEIYRLLDGARQTGAGILVSSSESDELLELCDRILVMYRSTIVADIPRDAATEELIVHHASGQAS